MSEIFLHQLQDNLKSLRFQISLLVLLFFFVGNGVVYTWRMERLTKEIAHFSYSYLLASQPWCVVRHLPLCCLSWYGLYLVLSSHRLPTCSVCGQ
jgi:hypothetical protein